jgi:hypothetical protein
MSGSTAATCRLDADSVEQEQQCSTIVHVGFADREAYRNPSFVRYDMTFDAYFSRICGVFSVFPPPLGAFTDELSIEAHSSRNPFLLP